MSSPKNSTKQPYYAHIVGAKLRELVVILD